MLANSRWRAGWAPARAILKNLRRKDERGVTLVEYALLIALIAVVAVGSLVLLGNTVNNTLTEVAAQAISGGNANDTISVNGGSPQSAATNAAFGAPFSVIVENTNSQPVSGITITFTAPAVGASGTFTGNTFSVTAVTGANGIATTTQTFTANATPGTYNVVATAVGVLNKANFALTNRGPNDTYVLSACTSTNTTAQVLGSFGTLSVTVTDTTHQGVSGVSVVYTAPANGASGTFAQSGTNTTTIITPTSGTATTTTFTANKVAGNNYAVVANAYVGSTLEGTATCTLSNTAAPAQLTAENGMGQSQRVGNQYAAALVALVADQYGNPYPGVTVTFSVPDANGKAGGTLTGGTCAAGTCTVQAVSDTNGLASATLTANNTAGAFNVTASATGQATGAPTFGETNLANGGSDHLIVQAGNAQSAIINSAFPAPLEVEYTNPAFQPQQGVTVNITAPVTGASGTFAGGASCNANTCSGATDLNGDFTTATFSANNVVGNNYTITVTAPGAPSVAFTESNLATTGTNTINVVAGQNQTAGVGGNAFQTDIEVSVTNGTNPVPSIQVTFTVPNSGPGGYFGGNASVNTDSSGDATAPTLYTNGTQGTFNVTVSAPNAASITIQETNSPNNLAIILGNNQSTFTGNTFGQQLIVQYSSGGNGVNTIPIVFTVNPSNGATATFVGGTCNGQTTCTIKTGNLYGNPGFATSPTLKAGAQGGTFTVTATATGVTVNSVTFTETDAGYNLQFIQPAAGYEETAVGTVFPTPLVVEALDVHNHPVANVAITFTVGVDNNTGATAAFGGTCSGASCTITTGANGEATAQPLTADNTAGYYQVTANAPAANGDVTANLVNDTYTLTITNNSNNQDAAIGAAFANPLTVQVQDQYGLGVDGVTVNFSAPSTSGASGTFGGNCNNATTCAVTTSGGGYAQVPSFTADSTTGQYQVTASVTGGGSPSVTFTETNTDYVLTIVNNGGNNQTAGLGAQFANAFEVKLTNNGTPVNNVPVTFTPPTSGASGTFPGGYFGCGTPCTVNNSTGGVYTAPQFTANNTAGANYSIVVSAVGAPATVSFTETNEAYTLAVYGGGTQSALTDADYGQSMQVQVELGTTPVTGVPITFTPPTSGASGTFPGGFFGCGTPCTVNSGNNGIVTAPQFTANGTAGGYNVVASSPGSTSVDFALTNEAYVVAQQTGDGQGQTVAPGAKYSTIQVEVTLNGSPVGAGIRVTFTTPNTNGNPSATFGGTCNGHTCTVTTNGAGVAQIATAATSLTANHPNNAGSFNISATAANAQGDGTSQTYAIAENVS